MSTSPTAIADRWALCGLAAVALAATEIAALTGLRAVAIAAFAAVLLLGVPVARALPLLRRRHVLAAALGLTLAVAAIALAAVVAEPLAALVWLAPAAVVALGLLIALLQPARALPAVVDRGAEPFVVDPADPVDEGGTERR